jgi:hypothetical protein
MSVTSTIPPSSTTEAFGEIFKPRNQNGAAFNNVILTLSDTVDALETAAGESNDAGSSPNAVIHLDGVPQPLDLDKIVAQYRPFRPPSPPVPQEQQVRKRKAATKDARRTKFVSPHPGQTSWSTTIVVTESTDSNGSKTYTASASPMVEISPPIESISDPMTGETFEINQPFLDRMRIRHKQWKQFQHERASKERTMQLISVKRRRKLKMNKHKYKKLMKRTRTLRRRLNRA